MTRKDFNLIAGIMRDSVKKRVDPVAYRALVHIFAMELSNTNKYFDFDKFWQACEADQERVPIYINKNGDVVS